MENTKIGNKEAIALLTTISFNQIIIFGVKSIINNTSSASLLNLLYLSIIILIFIFNGKMRKKPAVGRVCREKTIDSFHRFRLYF